MVQHALYHAGVAFDLGHQVPNFPDNFGAVGNDQLVQHRDKAVRAGFVQSEQAQRFEVFRTVPRWRILSLPNMCFTRISSGIMDSSENDSVESREMASSEVNQL